jgi:uncharacterized protein YajQ (UPF0234 family)
MPSFDIVSQVNEVELRNAVDQANKEIGNRFDFKGSDARVEQAEHDLTVFADDEFKLGRLTTSCSRSLPNAASICAAWTRATSRRPAAIRSARP